MQNKIAAEKFIKFFSIIKQYRVSMKTVMKKKHYTKKIMRLFCKMFFKRIRFLIKIKKTSNHFVSSLRRAEFRISNAAIAITDQSISWWTELIIEGASYVAFMWSSKTITWLKLITSIDIYIWAVCSSKCKSHVINMNIWLYRHWHFFENQKNPSCFTSNQRALKFHLLHEISPWFLAFWFRVRFHRL